MNRPPFICFTVSPIICYIKCLNNTGLVSLSQKAEILFSTAHAIRMGLMLGFMTTFSPIIPYKNLLILYYCIFLPGN